MADADKNIVITPNVGQTTEPNIVFTGQDNTDITLTVLDNGGLSFSGASGELFSIIDSAGGTIFSVNDVSGVPSIEVDDDGTIRLAEFAGNVLLGTATDNGTDLLQVDGSVSASSMSATTFTGALSGNASTASTLQTARTISLGGVLSGSASFNGGSNITITAAHTSDPVITLSGAVTGSGTMTNLGSVTIATTHTADPTITLTGAVTGSGTMTNLGNVSIATTATADPTLTLTGDVTGSATFTNLGNATLTATVANDSHTHDGRYYTESEADSRFVNVTGDTITGQLIIDHNTGTMLVIQATNGSPWAIDLGRDDATNSKVFNGGGYWAFEHEPRFWNAGSVQKLFHDAYHPNADKWTTARTLSLSGDASGSVSWDGSANATLSVTVADDSHNHSSSSGNFTVGGDLTVSGGQIGVSTASTRHKYSLYGNDSTYVIGMQSAITYGGLNDWAMTFQFNDEADRGFWWGDASHTTAQGAMALTTGGLLTVASGIRVGYGEADTTAPSAGLQVSGNITVTGTVDGRDVSADGSKLDGIEAGATADQTITAGGGLTGGGTGNVTISHADTSAQASVNNSNGTVIQDITLDTYGHITSLASVNLDGRYYTESEADGRFVNVTGDTMTGNLFINDASIQVGRPPSDTASMVTTNTAATFISKGVDQEAAQTNVMRLLRDGTSAIIYAGAADFDLYRHTDNSTQPNVGLKIRLSTTDTSTLYDALTLESNGNIKTGANNIFHDGYHPNADKWTTARTLSLSGDASGSVSWDGSANATLSVTVANDSHTHDGRYYTESEADSRFVNVAGDTMTGALNMGANNINMSNSNITGVNQITINDPGEGIVFTGTNNVTLYAIDDANDNIMNFSGAAELRRNNNKVWDAGNDGSGSGLDADLLDGVQGNNYVQGSNANRTGANANMNAAQPSGFYDVYNGNGTPTNTWYTFINVRHNNLSNNYGSQIACSFYDTQNFYVRNIDNGTYGTWAKIWNSSNDGSGSGLDADLLDGLQLHTGRNNEANKVVRTDASGYIQAGWINTTSGATTATLDRIYASNDGYIRYVTPATLASQLNANSLTIYNAAGTALKTIKGLI